MSPDDVAKLTAHKRLLIETHRVPARWECKVIASPPALQTTLADLGRHGWELVNVDWGRLVLRRCQPGEPLP